ncbi:MAG: UbiA-like polyprenyltransferase [Chloroflexota bacterium]
MMAPSAAQDGSNHTMPNRLSLLLENVRIEQAIFTLPFAYLGMTLAARGAPSLAQFGWATLAMVGARTFAMNMNRVIDLDLDRRNPRAAGRPLPSGRLSLRAVYLYSGLSVLLLFFSAWQLNPLCVTLFPLAMLVFTGYSYVKRFSWLTHAVLGLALGGAPVGGWIAVTGELSWQAALLGATVMSWATGFDILYACGDAAQDRALGVKTIPACFGVRTALVVSALVHLGTAGLLMSVGVAFSLGWPYWVAVAGVAGMLAYEHWLVSPNDLSRLNVAFFRMNGAIAVLIFVFAFAGLYT